jgi:hypothetical protein
MYRRRRLTKKRNSIAVPLFIIAIMVLSVIGYSLLQGRQDNTVTVNGFKFTEINNRWHTRVDGIDFMFYYSPAEVEDIGYRKISDFPTQIYLTSNPNAAYSQQDLMSIELAKFELKNTLGALGYAPDMQFSDEISCENSTQTAAVVDLDLGDETIIEVDENCIKISGTNGQEIFRARDKFLMLLLGIVE